MAFIVPIALACVLLTLAFFWLKGPKGIPPGPLLPLPLLRILPTSICFGLEDLEAIEAVRKKYGNNFSLHMGNRRVIFISNYEDVMGTFAREFASRPMESLIGWRDVK